MRKEQLEQLGFQLIKDGTYAQIISPVYLDASVIVRAYIDKETAIVSMRIVQNDQPAELIIGTCANRAADLKHLLSWLSMDGKEIGQHIVTKAIQRKKLIKTK
jgi:predicted nucleic acid-binding protein